MATISEFQQQVSLFIEALDVLSRDKSEVTYAAEQLAAAQAALAKEQGDVDGSVQALTGAWENVKATGDLLVADLTGQGEEPL
jgi:hypothetical protein